MVEIMDLWLPILLSAVFVFIASSILHMVIPIHKHDYKQLPGEDAILESMRGQNIAPGSYRFPYCASMKDLGAPEMMEKYKRGPVGLVTVLPSGPPTMGASLMIWFLYSILIGLFVAYLATLTLDGGAAYGAVFRVAGTAAILGYALSSIPESIWKGQSWGVTFKFIFDGVIYGLVTAGTFGWLWPAAA